MDLGLKDKVALVTGASQGIGLRTARRLAAEGCALGLCARTAPDMQQAAAELRGAGARVSAHAADVTDPAQAQAFVEQCAAELGGIDILINNVGGAEGGNLLEASDADWRRTFELNVFQVVRMIRLVVPHMRARGGGSIVNIASISGWVVALAGNAQYGSAKAAQIFLTERAALELVHAGIRVNVVSPGSIVWEGSSWGSWAKDEPEAYAAYVRDGFPMGRLGAPEEVADVIAFVASPAAHWINGRHIPVDGLEQPVPSERVW
jgi:NAD(P)-dependent dehydrogenase (short-subunit alcohol dehydrogenase family)